MSTQVRWPTVPTTRQYIGRSSDRALLRERLSELIADYVQSFRLRAGPSPEGPLYINLKKRLELKFLQRLVWDYVIDNPKLATQQFGQRKIIQTLFDIYFHAVKTRNKRLVPTMFLDDLEALDSNSNEADSQLRLVVDIIASLTDHQTLLMYGRLTGQAAGSFADI